MTYEYIHSGVVYTHEVLTEVDKNVFSSAELYSPASALSAAGRPAIMGRATRLCRGHQVMAGGLSCEAQRPEVCCAPQPRERIPRSTMTEPTKQPDSAGGPSAG